MRPHNLSGDKRTRRSRKRARTIIQKLRKLFPKAGMVLNYKNNWELMVAVQLSAQCTDKKVNEVTTKLFKKYLTLDDYVWTKPSEFEKDIYQTGFYRNKTKNILAAAKLIQKKYHGQLPRTMEEMLNIPGVARKTANVVLGNAYGIYVGIAVDTHVRRLTRLMGLTKHNDPVKIEQDLMALIPKKDWFKTTYLFIEYGRKYCKAKPHEHKKCPLRKFDI
jgi:endonuclease-3